MARSAGHAPGVRHGGARVIAQELISFGGVDHLPVRESLSGWCRMSCGICSAALVFVGIAATLICYRRLDGLAPR